MPGWIQRIRTYTDSWQMGKGIPDFQAPPPSPKFFDTSEAIDELPSYDSFDPAPEDF